MLGAADYFGLPGSCPPGQISGTPNTCSVDGYCFDSRGCAATQVTSSGGVQILGSESSMTAEQQRLHKETLQHTTPKPPASASSGIDAGQLLTGIGAILAPIAQAGVGIYTAQLQTKLAKDQLKYQQQQASFSPPPAYFPPPPQQTSPVIFIVIGLVALMMFGGMFFMMSGGGGTVSGATGTTGVTSTTATPRIARVRRVRRRPGSRSKK